MVAFSKGNGPPAIQGWKIAREKLYAKNYRRKVSCGNSKIALYILPARRQPSPRGIAARRPGCRPRPAAHPLLLTPCCSLPAAYTYAKRVLIPQDNNLLGKKSRRVLRKRQTSTTTNASSVDSRNGKGLPAPLPARRLPLPHPYQKYAHT